MPTRDSSKDLNSESKAQQLVLGCRVIFSSLHRAGNAMSYRVLQNTAQVAASARARLLFRPYEKTAIGGVRFT